MGGSSILRYQLIIRKGRVICMKLPPLRICSTLSHNNNKRNIFQIKRLSDAIAHKLLLPIYQNRIYLRRQRPFSRVVEDL